MQINTENDFWKYVQSPVTKLKDPIMVRDLALESARKFQSPLVRLAAITVFNWRCTEREVMHDEQYQEIASIFSAEAGAFPVEPSLLQLRWLISASISIAAVDITRSDDNAAFWRCIQNARWAANAHRHGQVFTNVVKSLLLAVVLLQRLGETAIQECESCEESAGLILPYSATVAENYKFSNNFVYEELGSVYNMLRQIYRWKKNIESYRLGKMSFVDTHSDGVEVKALGGGLNKIITGQYPAIFSSR